MSVVRINAISVDQEKADQLEARFAARAGEVSGMAGFEGFELLRPTDGRDVYLVVTHWRSAEDFEAWVGSDAFQRGHKEARSGPPVARSSELWAYDVVEREGASG